MQVDPLLSTVNGQIDNTINIVDRGLAYGDGVFETLLLCEGHLHCLDLHLDRLQKGLDALRIKFSRLDMEAQLERFLVLADSRTLTAGLLKIIVSRGQGRGYAPQNHNVPTVVIALFPTPDYPENFQQRGVAATVCQHRLSNQNGLAGIKHLNRLDNVLASMEVQDKNYTEGLLFDQQNHLVEAINRNIFIVQDSKLLTPILDQAGVKGVIRQLIVDTIAPSLNIAAQEIFIDEEQLQAADEVFLCNSVSKIWPVNRIDDQTYLIGPVTRAIQKELDRQLSQQVI